MLQKNTNQASTDVATLAGLTFTLLLKPTSNCHTDVPLHRILCTNQIASDACSLSPTQTICEEMKRWGRNMAVETTESFSCTCIIVILLSFLSPDRVAQLERSTASQLHGEDAETDHSSRPEPCWHVHHRFRSVDGHLARPSGEAWCFAPFPRRQ